MFFKSCSESTVYINFTVIFRVLADLIHFLGYLNPATVGKKYVQIRDKEDTRYS